MLIALAGCVSSLDTTTFDPCQPTTLVAPNATDDQVASIDDAIAMWHQIGVEITRGEPGNVRVEFRSAALALYGFYEDATGTIYINTGFTDETQRAIILAHELGHAFALDHIAARVRASVMNPGNVTRAPDDADRATLFSKWGECATRRSQ